MSGVNHAARAHAVLPPSAAHRWSLCTRSARIEEQLPDTTSEAASEGTLAHEICEVKLRGYFDTPNMTKRKQTAALKKLKENSQYAPEMEGHTEAYLDFIKGQYISLKKPVIAIEKSLDMSRWVPEGRGTADCIILSGSTLIVNDFKYGKGVKVFAKENPQLKLYALGALAAYELIYDIKTVRVCIIQPRLDHIDEWETSVEDLLAWGEWIKERAAIAFDGGGEFAPGEEQCRFCRARATCKARADYNVQLAFSDPVAGTDAPAIADDPVFITNDMIGKYLELGQDVARWLDELMAHALSECLAGHEVDGWKAVEGRAGNRTWTDQAAAFEALKAGGIKEALLWERKPVSLSNLEDVIGKKDFTALVGKYIMRPPGKPALVRASDKRPAITNKVTVEEAFGPSGNE